MAKLIFSEETITILEQERYQHPHHIVRRKYKGRPSELHDYTDVLKAHFTAHPVHSMLQAAAEIEEKTGLKRSTQQVRLFLRSLGFRPLRAGLLPAKADAQKQEDFKKKSWNRV